MRRSGTLASLTDAATTLSPDRERVLTFDREGRLLYYFRSGKTYKRSLASEVHLRFRRQTRQRQRLGRPAARELFAEVLSVAEEMRAAVGGEARRRIEAEVLRWTPDSLLQEEERFRHTYLPVSILPPDQYRAVVLQATEGCTWNHCTFCNFYMDRPFRLKSEREFRRHVKQVKALLGRGLGLRRGVFLADGNALALSNSRLAPLIDEVRREFPGRELFGFVDLYSGERRSRADWESLARTGLRRVYVGMESGLDDLLRFVNKPGSALELRAFVSLLKAAGLQVSLIVMIGLGGEEYRQRHREASLELLEELPLGDGDLVYLSPFIEHHDSRYAALRQQAGLTPMMEQVVESELGIWATRLRRAGLRTSRYDIREFIY